ncbi:signal peptidase II [Actinacidiphila paucisporea]|uniref:Lipoprotein signal peptidase n=1 Tax=Actinacidiphila paucisporea TaxID=310782 RepID=A0A1M7DWG6_9ACTN|nr:signal peptidase II [Actinacidiphila paucisporea]SHL83733.1 signal peptidase II Aspartic peptidase. MEROPS family A08 [Actinacidiphila paucisporea]
MTEAERIITTPDGETTGGAAQSAPGDPGPSATASGAGTADLAAKRRRRVLVLTGVAAFAYLLDLLSKIWVVTSLENHAPVSVFGHYLRLDAIRNAGAAFGLGQGMTIVFTLIAAGVIVVIARLSRRLYSVPWAIALGLLLGGAFGNLTDRVFRAPGGFQGRVVDFIAPAHFAVFNLADSAITCGGVLIVLLSFRGIDPDGTRHRD